MSLALFYSAIATALSSMAMAEVLHGVVEYCDLPNGNANSKAITHPGRSLGAMQFQLVITAASLLHCIQRCRLSRECWVISYSHVMSSSQANCKFFSGTHVLGSMATDAASTVVQLLKVPCIYHKPVHGGWTPWATSYCSATCGGGTYTRTRECTDPAPAYTGSSCPGKSVTETFTCNIQPCPIDGVWSQWESWQCFCSGSTCGPNYHGVRYRQCNNPPRQHGGLYCPGRGDQWRDC